MPYVLTDLRIDRVDLVDEGANSAAFIELFKRKEISNAMDSKEILSKMKPEHAEIIQADIDKSKADLEASNDALVKAKEELETLKASPFCTCEGAMDENGKCSVCGKPKNATSNGVTKKVCGTCGTELEGTNCPECAKKAGSAFDETETLKSMPEAARQIFEKMKSQKDAAEEEVRKAKEAEQTTAAVAKAALLKSLPVETTKLVELIKGASPDMIDTLESIAKAIEGTVLTEVGKSNPGSGSISGSTDAWAQIEAKATEVAKRDSVTKQKAIGVVIKEQPDLYKAYLEGGAN